MPSFTVQTLPSERVRSVGTVVSDIMVGILLGRTIARVVGAAYGWRAVYGLEAVFMVPVWIAAASLLPRGVPAAFPTDACSLRCCHWRGTIVRFVNR